MILVDTSVWVDHLRRGNARLGQVLHDGLAVTHAFVVGELACGWLARRSEILRLLAALPHVVMAEHEEVLRLVEQEKLHGLGLGWVDMHLLASARLSRSSLWTMDRALERAAARLDVAAR